MITASEREDREQRKRRPFVNIPPGTDARQAVQEAAVRKADGFAGDRMLNLRRSSAAFGVIAFATLYLSHPLASQEQGASRTTAVGLSRMPVVETTAANAAGDAADVLALEQKIEQATVRGDVAIAEKILSSDFHFRHGDGWTRGEKTGGIEDDRAAFMKRIADKEYLVHDLDNSKIEMHGSVAITHGRYVSLFVPKNANTANPPALATIWFERVWARRDGRWQWLSHRTVWGPHPSPAGVDPTQIPYVLPADYVPGLPPAQAAPQIYAPQSKEAAGLLDLETRLGASIPAGDAAFFDSHTSADFLMWHSDPWTRGSRSSLIDTKQVFSARVSNKQYLAWHYDSQQAEMHGDVAVTFGRYTATLRGSNPDRAWFAVWYERVYQRQDGTWMLLSQRTVHGATYGPTRESISDK
jgi:hypothetical protein